MAAATRQTQIYLANMYTTLQMSPASKVLATDETPAINSGKTNPEKRVSGAGNLTLKRLPVWQITNILEGIIGVFAVLYLFGAVALGVALLFYTFSR